MYMVNDIMRKIMHTKERSGAMTYEIPQMECIIFSRDEVITSSTGLNVDEMGGNNGEDFFTP